MTRIAVLSALALGAAAPAVYAQDPNAGGLQLEVVTPVTETLALSRIVGRPLHAANDEQLTTITDFLIDPQSGRVHFALAGSGSGPRGETFRIIPMAALQSSPGNDKFTLRMDRNRWDQVGTLLESRLQGKIKINQEHQERLSRQFALGGQPAPEVELMRASQFKGRAIRSGNEQVGTVEDVAVNLHQHIAAPMVAPAGGFAAGGTKFLIPFPQLQLGEQAQGAITTTLTRADFHRLQPGLSPTGQSSAAFGQATSIGYVATAVQQALSRDPSFATSGVQVIPESRIVLRGSVENQQKKAELERAAQQAAAGVRVDSEITVRGW